jgi:RNA polymerase sigma-70 factor, ECF subfamily
MLPAQDANTQTKPGPRIGVGSDPSAAPDFEAVYVEHFAFVWRMVRRMGVPDANAEDVAQEVFVIVHRRLESYEGRASLRAWLFGFVRGVVANYRRSAHRASARVDASAEVAEPTSDRHPHALAEKAEAVRTLHALLAELDDDKRDVFMLAELEQMPVVEIARALELNVNTAHSRLREGREQFKTAVARYRARQHWRSP